MQQKLQIPVVTESGHKYTTEQGFSAVKDGIKASPCGAVVPPLAKKPAWLKVALASTPRYKAVQQTVHEHKLSTVCEEAKCPNIGECWSHGTATIMLMGSVCTRACRFCSVDTGNPQGWLDPNEIANAAHTVALMDLDYIVLTSVDRDDLPDGGAAHYANAIKAIKQASPKTKVEALTPDFQGCKAAVDVLLASGLDVFAQNVETVERLTHPVRDPRAGYWQTLNVLKYAKQCAPQVLTKTSLMLGLGETEEELQQCMADCRIAGVDILTLGQYLQPTRNHLPVEKYVPPEDFLKYRQWGLARGFFEVASGPLVRSSYRADRVFKKNNLGLE
jgi:lipoyl synthase